MKQVLKVNKDMKGNRVLKEFKVHRVNKVLKEMRGNRVLKEK